MVDNNNNKTISTPDLKDYENTTFGSIRVAVWRGSRPKFSFTLNEEIRKSDRFQAYGEFSVNSVDAKIISEFVEAIEARVKTEFK